MRHGRPLDIGTTLFRCGGWCGHYSIWSTRTLATRLGIGNDSVAKVWATTTSNCGRSPRSRCPTIPGSKRNWSMSLACTSTTGPGGGLLLRGEFPLSGPGPHSALDARQYRVSARPDRTPLPGGAWPPCETEVLGPLVHQPNRRKRPHLTSRMAYTYSGTRAARRARHGRCMSSDPRCRRANPSLPMREQIGMTFLTATACHCWWRWRRSVSIAG